MYCYYYPTYSYTHTPYTYTYPSPQPVTTYAAPLPHSPIPPPVTTATRSLLLVYVPCYATEVTILRELGVLGDVRSVEMERVNEGLVKAHFYDLRHATKALHQIQEHYYMQQQVETHFLPGPGLIAGCVVWAQFASDDGSDNQGRLAVFNLSSDVTLEMLKQRFEIYGSVKEVREPRYHKYPKFVEFFDTRDAAKAIIEINGKEINGKEVVVMLDCYKNMPKYKKFINPPPPAAQSDMFLIKEEDDSRTTLMIKNIPQEYSKEKLLDLLDDHCSESASSSYDYFHLPLDLGKKCHVGYAFVNMTSPDAKMKLYKAFHLKKWKDCKEICEISYASVQGSDALKEHCSGLKFPCKMTEVFFDPPRGSQRPTTPSTENERGESSGTVENVILFGSFPTNIHHYLSKVKVD